MQRASLSYLVGTPAPDCTEQEVSKCPTIPNERGRSLLWIHLVLLWYLSITWVLALYWIGNGSLRVRRAQIEKTREKVIMAKQKAGGTPVNAAVDTQASSQRSSAELDRSSRTFVGQQRRLAPKNSDGHELARHHARRG